MSRHRNVRQMLDEYYDDDDDDGYYDDYDDHVVAAKPSKKPSGGAGTSASATSNKKKAAAAPQPKQQPAKGNKAQPPVTKKTTFAPDPRNKIQSSQQALPNPLNQPAVPPPPPPPPPGFAAMTQPLGTPSSKIGASSSSNAAPSAPPAPAPLLPTPAASAATIIPPELLRPPDRVPFTLVILGHVDAGKSTVTGHLLYATSSVAMRRPDNFAYLCDEDDRERSHGVTMDVATKTLRTQKFAFVLQDAPGHADYIPSMITGTSHADGAMLVVDATDLSATALEHGQLREHVWLMRGMGVSQVLVVINKMDLVDWDSKVYDDTADRVNKFLLRVGYAPSKIRFVPVSGLTGANVAKLEPNHLAWYYQRPASSSFLLAALDGFDPPPALQTRLGKPLRIVVTDVVGEQGRGVAIRGRVVQGWVAAGEALSVLPIGDTATLHRLSSLQQQDQAPPSSAAAASSAGRHASAGEVLDCVLNGVDVTRISVGSVLARPSALPPLAQKCRCKLWVLEGLSIPILRGTQAVFHISHLDVPCHISTIISVAVKGATRLRPKAVTANSQAEVEIVLSSPIVMEPFADCRALGRFVLRRGGDSIAIGRIEHVIS
jgi:elongation factor 1 alpha-like protein